MCSVLQAIDDNTAHECCMVDKKKPTNMRSEYVKLITFTP